jgi:hypothetical protein
MSWLSRPPRKSDYETAEEYEDALNAYCDAAEAHYEEKKFEEED